MLLTADEADDVTEDLTLAAVESEDEMEDAEADAADAADESVWALTPAKAAMARMRALESCMVCV